MASRTRRRRRGPVASTAGIRVGNDARKGVLELADSVFRLRVLLKARKNGAESSATARGQGPPAQDRFKCIKSTGKKPGRATVSASERDRQDRQRSPEARRPASASRTSARSRGVTFHVRSWICCSASSASTATTLRMSMRLTLLICPARPAQLCSILNPSEVRSRSPASGSADTASSAGRISDGRTLRHRSPVSGQRSAVRRHGHRRARAQ